MERFFYNEHVKILLISKLLSPEDDYLFFYSYYNFIFLIYAFEYFVLKIIY